MVAVDSGPILELARETYERNGFGDRVEYHRMHSSALTLAEPADVLVYDQVGGFAHEVGLTRNVKDLLDRGVLKPDARIVPGSFDLFVAPVSAPPDGRSRPRLDHRRERLRPRTVPSLGSEHAFRLSATADWLLGPGVLAAHLDARDEGTISFEVTTRVEVGGALTGILGYMRAHLDPAGGVSLTNDPADPGRFDRWHVYHPVEPPITVEPGDEVAVRFTINQRGELTNWRVEANGETRSASQFQGNFLDPLVMFDPPGDRVPPLSRAGACRRDAFDAIAQGLPFSELVTMLVRDHGDRFATPDEARRYARDMVAAYCEPS